MSALFDASTYTRVRKPLLEAEGLPPACYVDPAFYAREREGIFMRFLDHGRARRPDSEARRLFHRRVRRSPAVCDSRSRGGAACLREHLPAPRRRPALRPRQLPCRGLPLSRLDLRPGRQPARRRRHGADRRLSAPGEHVAQGAAPGYLGRFHFMFARQPGRAGAVRATGWANVAVAAPGDVWLRQHGRNPPRRLHRGLQLEAVGGEFHGGLPHPHRAPLHHQQEKGDQPRRGSACGWRIRNHLGAPRRHPRAA